MKTRTILARDLKPGDRYFVGEGIHRRSYDSTPPAPHDVMEVAEGHRPYPSEDYIDAEGMTLIWRDDARCSTTFDVFLPSATVEVIEEDDRLTPEALVALADMDWLDVMLWHYAGDLEHGSVEHVLRSRGYLEFVEGRLEHIRQRAAMTPHPLRAHAA